MNQQKDKKMDFVSISCRTCGATETVQFAKDPDQWHMMCAKCTAPLVEAIREVYDLVKVNPDRLSDPLLNVATDRALKLETHLESLYNG
jgi:ribosomal protein S27E